MIYTEIEFENHIEGKLCDSGYKSKNQTSEDYDKDLCLIPGDLLAFIRETQPKQYQRLQAQYEDQTATKLLKRISDEIKKRGLIDVLRGEVRDRGSNFRLVYFKPRSSMNPVHREFYKANRFTVMRQLRFSKQSENSVDMGLFVNGVPVVILELKNSLTGQDYQDAEKQFRKNRNPDEPLFRFKRCLAFFAVGNENVSMATRLAGQNTRFLPYNKEIVNPVNMMGHRTSYLWEEVLHPDSMLDLIENFVHIRKEEEKVYDLSSKKIVAQKHEVLIFPRYHQFRVVQKLKKAVTKEGTGHKYLIQHATGSGKSLSIGWFAHLLTSLYQHSSDTHRMFDSVIVVTDRKVLDKQIQNTIKQLEQTKGIVNAVENSRQLKKFIEDGKHIIITTIQKFPMISDIIAEFTGRKFAVIIDEVHSSQSGRSTHHLRKSLSNTSLDSYHEDEGADDLTDIDTLILKEMESHGQQPHISFFGFSGTPKGKTLEIFGRKDEDDKFKPFDVYSMKQSIAEGFTLDVLGDYTTYERYFRLNKKIDENPEIEDRRGKRMLVKWVDIHPHSIAEKTRIMLEHFTTHTANKIKGKARGMLVTRSRLHCVKYKLEFDKQMEEMDLSYRAIVGFSGKITDQDSGKEYTESSMNQFPEKETEQRLKYPENRILIANNKFQTGFDEPMLHTMYIDKKLSGLQGVQTLSRLNRTMSGKTDTFVLDFVNNPDDIQNSFQPYYQGTILTEDTSPNDIYTLEQEVNKHYLFDNKLVTNFIDTFYNDSTHGEKLQGILDSVIELWDKLNRDAQEDFRGQVQNFIRFYRHIVQIVDFKDIELEKMYIFLQYLVKKLPRRQLGDIRSIVSFIDLESFRLEKMHKTSIVLEEEGGALDPQRGRSADPPPEEDKEFLSDIIEVLNNAYGMKLTEDDTVKLENIQRGIHENEDLRNICKADNSESGKMLFFNELCNALILELANEDIHIHNKIKDNPEAYGYLKKRLYQNYSQFLG